MPLRSLAVALLLAACSAPSSTATIAASQSVGASGGTVAVASSDSSALAGTSITIPAGALGTTLDITISASSGSVTPAGAQTAGPVVEFGPDGTTFSSPATIRIPVALPQGATASSVTIIAVESDGSSHKIAAQSVSGGFATFLASGFTQFGCVIESSDGGPETCTTDADCGECGACVSGVCRETCDGGSATCAPGQTACGATCADLTSDTNNCGACGAICESGATCSGGACQTDSGPPACSCPNIPSDSCDGGVGPGPCFCPIAVDCADAGTCTTGEALCGSVCVDTTVDSNNCGTCGASCGQGSACVNSVCQTDGGSPVCVSDADCGSCGSCDGGSCEDDCDGGSACAADQTMCADGCKDLMTDPNNCGECGDACESGVGCQAGACQATSCSTNAQCPSGQSCVSGLCRG